MSRAWSGDRGVKRSNREKLMDDTGSWFVILSETKDLRFFGFRLRMTTEGIILIRRWGKSQKRMKEDL